MAQIKFSTAREAAYAISSELNSHKKIFSPRPWNFHKPENTEWWVVPTAKWPAFEYGKYYFYLAADILYAGLYVEKGISVGFDGIPNNLIMDKTWMWHKFIKDFASGKVTKTLDEIYSELKEPVSIYIGGSVFNDSFDPLSPQYNDIEFLYQPNKLTVKECNEKYGLLSGLNSVKNTNELVDKICKIENLDWLWLDVIITFPFKTVVLNNDEIIFDEQLLCDKVLRALSEWVRNI